MIKVTGYRLNQPAFKAENAKVNTEEPEKDMKEEQKVSEGMSLEKKVGIGAALVALAAVGIYMAKGKKAPNKGVDELPDLSPKVPDLGGSTKGEFAENPSGTADKLLEVLVKDEKDVNSIRTVSLENLKKIHRKRLYNRSEQLEELYHPQYKETPNVGKPSFKEKLSNIKNSIGETCSSAVDWLKGIGKAKKNKGLSEITAKKD